MVLNARALAVTAVLMITPAAAGCGYNTIPTKQERAEAAWADVQSQYQRRADLVPNLVATVQGAAIQERTTLTDVINARARATSVNVSASDLNNPQAFQQYQEAQGQLSGALSRLLVTVEAYPQLQANQNFLTLQSQLEGTENRIQIARRDYNEAVRDYNTTLRTFPQVIWAKTLHGGSKPMQLFTATAAAQSAPQVNFNLNAPPSNASAPGGGAAAVAPGSTPPAQ
ncbi:MAG: LemA family protein [Candidatus Brevundimonas colombiensis]|uniref:LemA family protein n=1 Tax=Candidatus Brevundimonas colombiensis TaxID=3121376 RepID=A0AAJ5WZ84_9CAUL|nr:LemA family protein [Brevundimonas sp.]WEK39505.1 MAG: LemA family protein [Brevundimonas sp.]